MKTIKIIIEKSNDGFVCAYAVNVEGLTGGVEPVQDAKQDILDGIETMKSFDKKPKILDGDYELVYKFDTQSLLKYYKGILSNPALEKITGINQKLIHQYSTGLKKPRPAQRKKIENGIHEFAKELLAIEL